MQCAGRFRLATLVQYVPLPVVAGYLGYVGYFCVAASAALACNVEVGSRRSMRVWPAVRGHVAVTHALPCNLKQRAWSGLTACCCLAVTAALACSFEVRSVCSVQPLGQLGVDVRGRSPQDRTGKARCCMCWASPAASGWPAGVLPGRARMTLMRPGRQLWEASGRRRDAYTKGAIRMSAATDTAVCVDTSSFLAAPRQVPQRVTARQSAADAAARAQIGSFSSWANLLHRQQLLFLVPTLASTAALWATMKFARCASVSSRAPAPSSLGEPEKPSAIARVHSSTCTAHTLVGCGTSGRSRPEAAALWQASSTGVPPGSPAGSARPATRRGATAG